MMRMGACAHPLNFTARHSFGIPKQRLPVQLLCCNILQSDLGAGSTLGTNRIGPKVVNRYGCSPAVSVRLCLPYHDISL